MIVGCEYGNKILGCEHGNKIQGCEHGNKILGCEHGNKILGCEHGNKILGCEHGNKILGCEHRNKILGSVKRLILQIRWDILSCLPKTNIHRVTLFDAELNGGLFNKADDSTDHPQALIRIYCVHRDSFTFGSDWKQLWHGTQMASKNLPQF